MHRCKRRVCKRNTFRTTQYIMNETSVRRRYRARVTSNSLGDSIVDRVAFLVRHFARGRSLRNLLGGRKLQSGTNRAPLVSSNGHRRTVGTWFIDQLRFVKSPCRRNEFFTRRLAEVSASNRQRQLGGFERFEEQQPEVNGL